MASEYYLTIRLDPHYQQFLRKHFNCTSDLFEFPVRHFYNRILENLVITKQQGVIIPETDDWAFKILLPNFQHKNPAFFRYFSEVQELVFKNEIKWFYDITIQKRIIELMSIKEDIGGGRTMRLDRQQCTLIVIDDYGFDAKDRSSFDRIYKNFTRFQQNQRAENFQINKKNNRAKC